jgi:hypothetical protein
VETEEKKVSTKEKSKSIHNDDNVLEMLLNLRHMKDIE